MPGVDIKKNDEVQVVAGKDRGKRGRVVNVLPAKNRVMVEGVARVTKATRPTRNRLQGGLIQQEMFVDLSNVQVVCKTCGRATRVGHRIDGDQKVRVCRKCEADL
jgi:large subunit ribosomal protein L24